MKFGVSSMTAPLRAVAIRAPGPSLFNADRKLWHYGERFDPSLVADEHARFADYLAHCGVEICWMTDDDLGIADAIFTYDASLVTPAGAVLMNPGKPLRRGEERLHEVFYQSNQIPVIGRIEGVAHAEAGDTLWLNDEILAVGQGGRTNGEGVQQLKAILEPHGIAVLPFDMPDYGDEEACLHLMSLVSLVDKKTALICWELMPPALYDLMVKMGFSFIEAPFDEFAETGTLSLNVLAIAPSRCVMVNCAPKTVAAITAARVDLHLINATALCIGCEGGPTCLTRPLLRA